MPKYWDKRFRDEEIVRLSSEASNAEIAEKLGICKRTVERTLKAARGKKGD